MGRAGWIDRHTMPPSHVSHFTLSQSSMCAMTYGIYLAGAAMVALMTLFVAVCLPETRGVHIEAMDALWAAHPVWRRWADARAGAAAAATAAVSPLAKRRAKMSDDGV